MVLLAAAAGAGEQGSAGRVLEDLAHALARLGRAFEVVLGADLLRYRHTLRDKHKSGLSSFLGRRVRASAGRRTSSGVTGR